ncbi:MAG: UvrD-helicase domain-containing protein, partial [Geminicoccaceae bacterium]|nr:UvrD-helicase domain-containing protein [Geminicoccaceae bacterium]
MDPSWLAELNEAQRAAVTAPPGHTLVLAGAGSGKTRVLTRRIAFLLAERGVSPWSLLAVTFTNKAAGEMRGRVAALLGARAERLAVGTFHGIAHRFLRQHAKEAGLPPTFQILDAEDQLRLVKRVTLERRLDPDRFPPRQTAGFINAHKDEGLRPERVETAG